LAIDPTYVTLALAEAGANPLQSATKPTDRQANKTKLFIILLKLFEGQHRVAP